MALCSPAPLIVFLGPALFFSLIAFARPGEPAAFIIALVIMSAIRVRTVLRANPQRELRGTAPHHAGVKTAVPINAATAGALPATAD